MKFKITEIELSSKKGKEIVAHQEISFETKSMCKNESNKTKLWPNISKTYCGALQNIKDPLFQKFSRLELTQNSDSSIHRESSNQVYFENFINDKVEINEQRNRNENFFIVKQANILPQQLMLKISNNNFEHMAEKICQNSQTIEKRVKYNIPTFQWIPNTNNESHDLINVARNQEMILECENFDASEIKDSRKKNLQIECSKEMERFKSLVSYAIDEALISFRNKFHNVLFLQSTKDFSYNTIVKAFYDNFIKVMESISNILHLYKTKAFKQASKFIENMPEMQKNAIPNTSIDNEHFCNLLSNMFLKQKEDIEKLTSQMNTLEHTQKKILKNIMNMQQNIIDFSDKFNTIYDQFLSTEKNKLINNCHQQVPVAFDTQISENKWLSSKNSATVCNYKRYLVPEWICDTLCSTKDAKTTKMTKMKTDLINENSISQTIENESTKLNLTNNGHLMNSQYQNELPKFKSEIYVTSIDTNIEENTYFSGYELQDV